MALDRQSIEKKDFPIGRRGYDPDAVDAHLHALAEEVDELKRTSRRRSESLAAAASEQVRSIVEAAEATAAEIQRQAEDEAREIRVEASSEAASTREHATSEAREYVGKVSESTGGMLERINAMETELNALIESLRTGSNRLNADLQLLEGNLGSVKDAVVPRPRFEPEAASAAQRPAPVPLEAIEPAAASSEAIEPAAASSEAIEPAAAPAETIDSAAPEAIEQAPPAVPSAEPFERSVEVAGAAGGEVLTDASAESAPPAESTPPPESTPSAESTPPRTNGGDDESARLIALNMVMNSASRDEIDRYLAENFHLTDRRALLDEVYSSFEG